VQLVQCKDCGTGYCEHGRQKGKCKDCGTGYCEHGRQKCEHGRKESKCREGMKLDTVVSGSAGKRRRNDDNGVGNIELAPVGSSYILVGRCYLFREENCEVFLIKGNYELGL
jgi:hypothetical protein